MRWQFARTASRFAISASRRRYAETMVEALELQPRAFCISYDRVSKGAIMLKSVLGIGLAAFATSASAQPYSASEMQVLLSKGLVVASSDIDGGKTFTASITLASNGVLSGSLTPAGSGAVKVSGKWKLTGAQVCRTLEPLQPEEICETWVKSGPKQATIQVDGKNVSVNRW